MKTEILISSKYLASKLKEFGTDLRNIQSIWIKKQRIDIDCEDYWIEISAESINYQHDVRYNVNEIDFNKFLKMLESIDDQPIKLSISKNRIKVTMEYFYS